MAKYQNFLSRVGSNRDRAALRGIFSMFLTDDDPPKLKDLTLASIVLSGSETTQITISGACTTGISLTSTCTTGLSIGAGSVTAIQTGAKANVIGSGTKLALVDDFGAVRFFSDDNGVNVPYSVRGVQSRTLLTVDQSGGSIRALQGQLKMNSGVDVATGIYTAVQAYVEAATTNIASAGATLSCLDASLEISAGTLTPTGEVYGIHVECTGSGAFGTVAGTCAAIGITKGGTPVWTVGLYIAPLAVTTAISVGTKSNSVGSGVAIPSTDDWGAVRIFTDDNDANIADSVRALQSRTLLHASQSAGTIRAIQGQFKVIDGVGFDTGVYTPVQGYIELAGTHTVAAAGVLACFDASIEIGTALTATGYVAGFKAELTGAGTCAAGLDCGFLVTNAAGAAVWTYGLYVEASAVDTGVYIGSCTTGISIVNATKGIDVSIAAIGASGRIVKFAGSAAAGNFGDGYGAVECELTLTGTIAGQCAGLSSWVNIGASAVVGGNMICAQDNGIYVPTAGAPMATAIGIMGMRMSYVAEGGENPGALHLFSTNISSNVLTSLFRVNAIVDMGGSTGAQASNDYKIPLFYDQSAGQLWYVNIYHS